MFQKQSRKFVYPHRNVKLTKAEGLLRIKSQINAQLDNVAMIAGDALHMRTCAKCLSHWSSEMGLPAPDWANARPARVQANCRDRANFVGPSSFKLPSESPSRSSKVQSSTVWGLISCSLVSQCAALNTYI